MRRAKSELIDPGEQQYPIFGTLAHSLAAAPSAMRGRWVTINVWEPDPTANPITNPALEDVLPIIGVGASSFIVAGDVTDELKDQFPIVIRSSTPNGNGQTNDGPYILNGDPSYSALNDQTTITIVGVPPDVAITDGELVIVRPTVLRASGRKACVVSRSNVTAAANTFVMASPIGFEWLIEVINCAAEGA